MSSKSSRDLSWCTETLPPTPINYPTLDFSEHLSDLDFKLLNDEKFSEHKDEFPLYELQYLVNTPSHYIIHVTKTDMMKR